MGGTDRFGTPATTPMPPPPRKCQLQHSNWHSPPNCRHKVKKITARQDSSVRKKGNQRHRLWRCACKLNIDLKEQKYTAAPTRSLRSTLEQVAYIESACADYTLTLRLSTLCVLHHSFTSRDDSPKCISKKGNLNESKKLICHKEFLRNA